MLPPINETPSPWREWLIGFLIALAAATIGRLMWHIGEVQRGRRLFWSWALVAEVGIAIGMGLIGAGVAEYFNITGNASVALIAALSYLGPRGIEAMIGTWVAGRK